MRQHLTPFSHFLHRQQHMTKRPHLSTSTDTLPRDWRREHWRHWGTSCPSHLCFVNKSILRAFSWTVLVVWFFTPWQVGGECGHGSEESPTNGITCLFFHPLFFFAFCIGARSSFPPDMDELLKHLTEVSIRQQQIVEHLATRQGQTEHELAALRAAAPHVPPPDAHAQAARLLPKMTPHDDVKAFFQMFENTATMEGWLPTDWARALAPLLTGEAQRAYFSLPAVTAGQYDEVKREILARLGLSAVCAAQHFHVWEYKSRLPAQAQAHWLLEGNPSAAQVAERVVIDRLLRALPRSHRQAVGMRNPTTTLELVEAIELADATQQRDAGERAPPFPRRGRPSRPAAPSPRDEPMPTEPPTPPARTGWQAASYTGTFPLGRLRPR